jgi:hypothetical protein
MLTNHLKPNMSVVDVGSSSGYLTVMFVLVVCVTFFSLFPSVPFVAVMKGNYEQKKFE